MSGEAEPRRRMPPVTVYLPPAYLEGLDRLVEAGIYGNRSEAIRMAVRDLVNRELPMVAGIRRGRPR
jgi:Arc/MetJ-type ribon-helix-helix transcriptional regulator